MKIQTVEKSVLVTPMSGHVTIPSKSDEFNWQR